jgi:type IX secretion system PorP/SprF family membrane protein
LFFGICVPSLQAQWDAQISQYWVTKTYYNPAFAGETKDMQTGILSRQQWVGVDNAPKTFIVFSSMPMSFLGRQHGVGVLAMTESIGLFKNTLMGGQYAYKKKFKNNVLNIGVQVGMSSITFDASQIHIPSDGDYHQTEDEAKPISGEQTSTLDANIGVAWQTPNYYVGFSTSHITEPSFDLGENHTSYIARGYYLMGGYNIKLRNPLYQLQPSFLVKSDLVVTQYDLTARMVYNKMFNGGISWRKDDGFVFLLGVSFKSIDAGYAYDLSTSAIGQVSKGSHEFYVRYNMPINKPKQNKNSHKSVRIL